MTEPRAFPRVSRESVAHDPGVEDREQPRLCPIDALRPRAAAYELTPDGTVIDLY
jgi:hypothetical protein